MSERVMAERVPAGPGRKVLVGLSIFGPGEVAALDRRQGGHQMLMGIAKVLGGIILTGVGVVAAAMGAGVTGDGIAETLNGGSAGSSESSSTLRKAS